MKFNYIDSGEVCALQAIEITSIPDISILLESADTNINSAEYINRTKNNFSNLLNEVFLAFKSSFNYELLMQDISIELMWYAEPVLHQTYQAKVRLFLVLRAIGQTKSIASEYLEGMLSICKSTLITNKYTVDEADDIYLEKFASVSNKYCNTVLKEDRVANLQSYVLPQCYSYDKLPDSESDLSSIVETMMRTPGSAVSYQLIPALLSAEEVSYLETISNNLDTVNKGIHDMQIGNITNPIAERHAEVYKYYETRKHGALFDFNTLIFADFKDLYKLTASVCGLLDSGSVQGSVNLRTMRLNDLPDLNECVYSLPWYLNELIADDLYNAFPLYTGVNFDIRRLSNIVTADEAGNFFRLPIGSKYISAGININYAKKDNKNYHKKIINDGDIMVGKLKSSSADQIGFYLKDINKHMLIVGTTGMGKTTYSVGLLDTLWKKFSLPFLVIEPAKTEYRALIDSIPDIQIFTPGKDNVSPFVYNPFVPPKGVRLKTYKSVLKSAFAAGVTMTTPLDKIFEETVNNCYSAFGWLDSYTVDDGGRIFNISDFAKEFERTFEALGYVGEAKNIGRAGLVRLTSMINLFDNYYSIPIEDMLSKPTIIELAGVPNKDEKALLISLILLNVSAYIDNNYLGDGKLRNIILLEEAHNLLDSSDNNAEGSAQPNSAAQDLLKSMLAEKRSQGLGIVIADQSPEKVGADIIKQTNIKLSFNLVEKTDKEIFANSTNMEEEQTNRMTRLIEGEAFFFMNGMTEPEEVITPDYRADHDIRTTISDDEVAERSAYWNDKKDKLMPYPECSINQHCDGTCSIADRELANDVARKIFAKYFNDKSADAEQFRKILSNLVNEANAILAGKKTLTKKLYCCIRMHFIRKVKYGTKIKVSDEFIRNNLLSAGTRK